MSKMIAKDDSITCIPRIALRGSIKVKFEKIFWGRRPMGRATQRGIRRGGRGCKRGGKRSPMPKDRELGRWAS
jgi:hypothetical protein